MPPAWTPYLGDAYLDFPALQAWCEQTAAAFPDRVRLESVGESRHGRPLLLLTLGKLDGKELERPAFWLDGGTHASEWTGVMATLYAISRWLDPKNAAMQQWLEHHTVYVMPCISPDGFQALMEGQPFLRSSLRPPPEGQLRVGLDPRDIDGDGKIGWMRWRHPAGPFVPDEQLPQMMRHRTLDDDPANAWFMADEGEFLSWDGVRWTMAPAEFGMDLNRNFPASWEPFRMFGMDGGEVPLSEPESRAVVDAVRARPGIAAALTNHTYTGALLSQPYRDPSPLGRGDIDLMAALGKDAVRDTGWRMLKVHPDFVYDPKKAIVGVWADTLSSVMGLPGYTLELWDPFGFAGLKIEKPAEFFVNPDHGLVRDMMKHFATLPGAVWDWRPFNHPQLGPVELGGFDYMHTIRNPPVAQLPAECDKAFRIADRLRKALPRVEATCTARVESGVHVLELMLENQGYLPTSALKLAETLGLATGLRVSLTLCKGVTLIDGELELDLGHLDGWGNAAVGGARHTVYASLEDRGHRARARWVLAGRGTVTVRWSTPRAGRGECELQLG